MSDPHENRDDRSLRVVLRRPVRAAAMGLGGLALAIGVLFANGKRRV